MAVAAASEAVVPTSHRVVSSSKDLVHHEGFEHTRGNGFQHDTKVVTCSETQVEHEAFGHARGNVVACSENQVEYDDLGHVRGNGCQHDTKVGACSETQVEYEGLWHSGGNGSQHDLRLVSCSETQVQYVGLERASGNGSQHDTRVVSCSNTQVECEDLEGARGNGPQHYMGTAAYAPAKVAAAVHKMQVSYSPLLLQGICHVPISDNARESDQVVHPSINTYVVEPAASSSSNGVSHYEIGFPDVLRPPLSSSTDNASLHAFIIHYSLLQEIQVNMHMTPATQFILLNHSMLAQDVTQLLSVRLNLPHQECVTTHVTFWGTIALTTEQMNIAKAFNTLLFQIVLGTSFLDLKKLCTTENKIKGYLVMPLKGSIGLSAELDDRNDLIDWTLACNLVRGQATAKEWIHWNGCLGQNTMDGGTFNDSGPAKGWLRLKSGWYKEEDLMDSFVTYGPWNLQCFIVGISKELCGSSMMQGSISGLSYEDHWLKRFNVELKHAPQPLLVGFSLSHVGNFLQRPTQEAQWCTAKSKQVAIPPEVCIVHTGFKGSLWRGAFRLPSILCSLENALLASQLRDIIGPKIPFSKVQEALTSGAYNVHHSYERLELVGDSFLTLVGAASLFVKNPSMSRDILGCSLHDLVENKQWFHCAETCGLASYVFNQPFIVKEWIPPGPLAVHCGSADKKRVWSLRRQRISWRTLADVVEAIVGAYIMHGGVEDAIKAMSWLKITMPFALVTDLPSLYVGSLAAEMTVVPPLKIADLERQLKYDFRNHHLLSAALSYHSDEPDGGLHFSRLSYLGDCILSHYIAMHLVRTHPLLDVGVLNEMKQSVINKESLAYAAVRRLGRPNLIPGSCCVFGL